MRQCPEYSRFESEREHKNVIYQSILEPIIACMGLQTDIYHTSEISIILYHTSESVCSHSTLTPPHSQFTMVTFQIHTLHSYHTHIRIYSRSVNRNTLSTIIGTISKPFMRKYPISTYNTFTHSSWYWVLRVWVDGSGLVSVWDVLQVVTAHL